MSFIDYETSCKATDKRVLKSRQIFFRSFLECLAEKEITKITISEICKRGSINRNTFYCQYNSIHELIESLEKHIIITTLSIMENKGILSYGGFKPAEYIYAIDEIRLENLRDFNIIYPVLRNSKFFRLLSNAVENFEQSCLTANQKANYSGGYVSALIFSITGLTNMYFDWIDDNQAVPIDDLAELAEKLLTVSLSAVVNK